MVLSENNSLVTIIIMGLRIVYSFIQKRNRCNARVIYFFVFDCLQMAVEEKLSADKNTLK